MSGVPDQVKDQTEIGKSVITAQFEPDSEQSRADRALFFATAVSMFCAKGIQALIAHCEKGSGQENLTSQISETTQGEAIKELVCLTLLIALLEQSNEEAPWLKSYFADCYKVTDQLFPLPLASSVVASAQGLGPEDICQISSMNLCYKLGLGATVEDASIYIGQLLTKSQGFRSELLRFTLTSPMDELDQYIKDSR
jgi:hypothetical protein